MDGGRSSCPAASNRLSGQAYPDLPTVSEAGVPGFDVSGSHSLYAPAATPPANVLAINKEVNRIMLMPDIRANLAAQGADVVAPNSPPEFKAAFAREVTTWGKFFKSHPDLLN